jgi:hypothetical protein
MLFANLPPRAAVWLIIVIVATLVSCQETPDPALSTGTVAAEVAAAGATTVASAPAGGFTPEAPPAPTIQATTYPAAATPGPGDSTAAYPPVDLPLPSATVGAYPAVTLPPAPTTQPANSTPSGDVFLPMVGQGPRPTPVVPTAPPTATPTATPSLTPTPSITPTPAPTLTPTPFPTVDFAAARAQLQVGGQEIAFNKIGFHVTFLQDKSHLDDYMRRLDEAGVPIFIKSVDNAEPLFRAQEMMRASGVPHVLVYRATAYDVPDYSLPPEQAAATYWQLNRDAFPPELDPSLVWLETMNEVDKERSEWLAVFAKHTAELALADGFRWAAFGWASGEPEPDDWQSPAMLDFLRLVAANPDRLAIALHEYSYLANDIGHEYPYKVGRFHELFRVADRHGFARPTVLITEWGWEYNNIPPIPQAIEDINWAARLYAPYPQVKGAAIWNLGRLGENIIELNDEVEYLIDPLMEYSLTHYFAAPPAAQLAPITPEQFPPPPP